MVVMWPRTQHWKCGCQDGEEMGFDTMKTWHRDLANVAKGKKW